MVGTLVRLPAQNKYSYYGDVHTPKGNLHILLVFVRYENTSRMNSPIWPDETARGVLPEMGKGEENALFNTDPETIGKPGQPKNLSDFYYHMSGGKFKLSGEVFPVQVPVTFETSKATNFFSRQSRMNKEAVKWMAENYPDFDWKKFDQRTNRPAYQKDNSESKPDGILDYVVFMHRNAGLLGASSPGNFMIPGTQLQIKDGHTGIQSYAVKDQNWQYFLHEFAHNLYTCPHYLGTNKSDGDRFYTQKGWGMMPFGNSLFGTANAWEAWWLDWITPQTITREGTYELKDFVTGRDAIRIQIPGTRDYLWMEYHAMKQHWDKKIFYYKKEKGYPPASPGVYMYVVGSPGAEREKARLNPFQVNQVNFIQSLNAEGRFDYALTGDSAQTEFFKAPVHKKLRENPIAGQHDFQWIRVDGNGDGKLKIGRSHGNKDGGGGEQLELWAEELPSGKIKLYNHTGDENDAFQEGDKLGLSGTFPVLNYPRYMHRKQQLQPFILNGLEVEITGKTDDAFLISVRMNQWKVEKDVRWCGNILLSSEVDLPGKYLEVAKKKELLLDLGGTPDRTSLHPETATLTNPTQLEIQANRGIRLIRKSKMIVENHATLKLTANAQLDIQKGAELIIKKGGKFILEGESQLIVRKKGKLTIEEGGEYSIQLGASISSEPKAKISGVEDRIQKADFK